MVVKVVKGRYSITFDARTPNVRVDPTYSDPFDVTEA
jgi:hypothetical protein